MYICTYMTCLWLLPKLNIQVFFYSVKKIFSQKCCFVKIWTHTYTPHTQPHTQPHIHTQTHTTASTYHIDLTTTTKQTFWLTKFTIVMELYLYAFPLPNIILFPFSRFVGNLTHFTATTTTSAVSAAKGFV